MRSKRIITNQQTMVKQDRKTDQKLESVIPVRRPQAIKGLVVESKLPKTATILVERVVTHPLYRKSVKRSKRYLVHDDLGVKEGDVVEVIQARPISKLKSFKILRVVGRDIELMASEELKEEAAEAIAQVMPPDPEAMEGEPIESKESKERSKKTKSAKGGSK